MVETVNCGEDNNIDFTEIEIDEMNSILETIITFKFI